MSIQSCGKPRASRGYGNTASGYNLAGHTWSSARTIAADPNVLPMGTKVLMVFDNPKYSKYNGIYTVRDVGGAIKGNKIDFFMGDFDSDNTVQEVWNFGVTNANLYVINDSK